MNNDKVHPSRAFSFLFRSKIAFTSARTPPSSWEQSQGFTDQVPSADFRRLPSNTGDAGFCGWVLNCCCKMSKAHSKVGTKTCMQHQTLFVTLTFHLQGRWQQITGTFHRQKKRRRTSVLIYLCSCITQQNPVIMLAYWLKTLTVYISVYGLTFLFYPTNINIKMSCYFFIFFSPFKFKLYSNYIGNYK